MSDIEFPDPKTLAFLIECAHKNAIDEDRERAKTPKQLVLEQIDEIKKEVEDRGCGCGESGDGDCYCRSIDWDALVKAVEAL